MRIQSLMKKCILPLLLILALLFPASAWAAPAVPAFNGAAAIELNRNVPAFSPEEISAEDFVAYSELDALGRAGRATVCVSRDALSDAPRADNEELLPVGWSTARYEDLIDGRWLYSVCNVIAPSLSGDASDPRNAFTGTRCLHLEGMKVFEDRIADYISRTTNHVLLRVTPVYRGKDLVPTGVQMEACSVEDAGRTISFNVFLYNIQPGISIDYSDGTSRKDAAVELSSTAAELLRSHDFPAPSEIAAPSVKSFSALYDQRYKEETSGTQTQTQQQQQTSRTVYIPENDDGIYHLIPNCGNMNSAAVRRMTENDAIASGHTLCTGDCVNYY